MPNFDLSAWQDSRDEASQVAMSTEQDAFHVETPVAEPGLTACRECMHLGFIGSAFEAWNRVCIASPVFHFDAFRGVHKQHGFQTIQDVNVAGACAKFQRKEGS
jgi:hypothetical protein